MRFAIAIVALALSLLPATVVAQDATIGQGAAIEYGDVHELRDITKFYIDAGEDLDLHDIIRDILEKQLKLAVVDKSEDAEHIIVFRWYDGGTTWRCHAFVARRLAVGRLRILSNYRGKETELNDLAEDYAKWLVKRLKEVAVHTPAG